MIAVSEAAENFTEGLLDSDLGIVLRNLSHERLVAVIMAAMLAADVCGLPAPKACLEAYARGYEIGS